MQSHNIRIRLTSIRLFLQCSDIVLWVTFGSFHLPSKNHCGRSKGRKLMEAGCEVP